MNYVFRKEITEMLRDKRVRSSAFFGPIFIIMALLYVLGTVVGGLGKAENMRIHLVKTTNPMAAFLRQANFKIEDVAKESDAEGLIKAGKAKAVIAFEPEVDGVSEVKIYTDPKEQLGSVIKGAISKSLSVRNDLALASYLEAHKVPPSQVAPVKITPIEVKVGEKGGASEFIVGMLPYLIVIWAFYGGMSTATDLVAGEKERNTLETLLITPQSRTGIVIGKLLALGAICLSSSLASLIGLIAYSTLKLPGYEMTFKNGFGVSFVGALQIVALLVPLVAFFASLLLSVSTFAKNAREAQTYLSLASFVVIIPAMFSQFIGLTEFANAKWINFVPILNTANNIRMTLMGKPDLSGSAITIGVSLILAAAMIRFTVVLFNRETVLVRI